jgi:hypothetical protein
MKNARKVYSAVMKTPDSTQKYAYPEPNRCDSCTASISMSLEKNPDVPGNPISAREPIKKVQYVMGMYLRRPPILRMSCSWCIPMITEPAARNSSALKKACVIKWKMPAP